MNKFIPRELYLKKLPKKIVATGVILQNQQGEILLVKQSYRDDGWSLPGGVVDKNESIIKGAEREVQEEIGIMVKMNKLLLIEHKYNKVKNSEIVYDSLQWIFLGETLDNNKIKTIKIDNDEIIDYKFVPFEIALQEVAPPLKRRLKHIKDFNKFYYIEDGELILINT